MPIAIVVDKRAAGIPPNLGSRLNQSSLLCYIRKRAVAVVAIERILAVIRDQEIIAAIVVVVAHAAGLAPASSVLQSRTDRHIGEGSIAIVLEETTVRFLALRKTLQPPAIDQKEIDPAIVIVVVEGQATASSFKEVFIGEFAAVDCLNVEA